MLGSIGSRAARASRIVTRVLGDALTPRALFLTGSTLAVFYATVLLIVIRTYRKGYGGPGKPELLALQFVAKCSTGLEQKRNLAGLPRSSHVA